MYLVLLILNLLLVSSCYIGSDGFELFSSDQKNNESFLFPKNEEKALTKNKTTLHFEGASISQGMGATFPLQHRIDSYLKSHNEIFHELNFAFPDKKIAFFFDYFFVTNFPFWGHEFDQDRKERVEAVLEQMSQKYDYLLYSPLPNESMLYENQKFTKQEWNQHLAKSGNENVRNQFGDFILAQLASRHREHLKVRDQINQTIEEFVKKNSKKFIKLPLAPFVQNIVLNGGIKLAGGDYFPVKKMFADPLHFNDFGQTVFINEVLLPGMEKAIRSKNHQVFLPKLEAHPRHFNRAWRKGIQRQLYSNSDSFLSGASGRYQLKFESKHRFINRVNYVEGKPGDHAPAFSNERLRFLIPTLLKEAVKHLDLSLPLEIRNDQVVLDIRKVLQAREVLMEEIDDGVWQGMARDYWFLTAAGMNTNYRFVLKHLSGNRFELTMEVYPLLRTQFWGYIRQNHLDDIDMAELLENGNSYPRLVLRDYVTIVDPH